METTQTHSTRDDERWQAVMARDGGFDGAFVYAVATTGIFCRPSCPSRRPRRHRVSFFAIPEAAARAGFRACKRCRPEDAPGADPRLATVRRLCRIIEDADEGIPTLVMLGAQVNLSPHHLQRLFTGVMGILPRQYAEALRLGRVKEALRDGEPVTAALYGASYGLSSRLYEKAPQHLGMTPVSYAKGGKGTAIAYAIAASPLGRLLVAATMRGVCMVSLCDDDMVLERELARDYPAAVIRRDDGALGDRLDAILAHLEGR